MVAKRMIAAARRWSGPLALLLLAACSWNRSFETQEGTRGTFTAEDAPRQEGARHFTAVAEDEPTDEEARGFVQVGRPLGRPPGAIIADHRAADAFPDIPAEFTDRARERLRIFFGHTSHGSQLVTGLGMLMRQNPRLSVNTTRGALTLVEVEGDLGTRGDQLWAEATRIVLGRDRSTHNVVIWSWCGGVSENTAEGIDSYLETMSALESEFPDIVFVYMTGHTDGSGPEGTVAVLNERIRRYCRDNDKVLFDFADIESWDPEGTFFPDANDDCRWCEGWCRRHRGDCPRCEECAHSNCFNCLRKGQALWWLLARLVGWTP